MKNQYGKCITNATGNWLSWNLWVVSQSSNGCRPEGQEASAWVQWLQHPPLVWGAPRQALSTSHIHIVHGCGQIRLLQHQRNLRQKVENWVAHIWGRMLLMQMYLTRTLYWIIYRWRRCDMKTKDVCHR